MPPKKTWIWYFFDADGDKVRCNCLKNGAKCQYSIQANATYCAKHLQDEHDINATSQSIIAAKIAEKEPQKKQRELSLVARVSNSELELLALAEGFLPHMRVESFWFRKLVGPTLVIVKRHTVSAAMIELAAEKKQKALAMLANKQYTLVCDSGTVWDRAFVVLAIAPPLRPILINAYFDDDFADGSQTGPELAKKIDSCSEECRGYSKRCVAIVADNGSNMVSGTRLSNLFAVHCGAHILQLIVKDVLVNYEVVLDEVEKLRKEAQGKEQLHPPQVCPTRWNSTLRLAEYLWKNRDHLAIEERMEIFTQINALIKTLNPYKQYTDAIQATSANTFTTAVVMTKLLRHTTNKQIIENRLPMFFSVPLACIAFFAPNVGQDSLCGQNTTTAQVDELFEVITVMMSEMKIFDEDCVLKTKQELTAYVIETRSVDAQPLSFQNFMKFISTLRTFPHLAQIILTCLQTTASEADAERFFSQLKVCCPPSRKNLNPEGRIAETWLHVYAHQAAEQMKHGQPSDHQQWEQVIVEDEQAQGDDENPEKRHRAEEPEEVEELAAEEQAKEEQPKEVEVEKWATVPSSTWQWINKRTAAFFSDMVNKKAEVHQKVLRSLEKCGVCKKAFEKHPPGEAWLECDVCHQWYSLVCYRMPTSLHAAATELPEWKCSRCSK